MSAKVQKNKRMANQCPQHKVQTVFLPGTNSLVSDPWQGCFDSCPTLANAGLAMAGSGSLQALAFRALGAPAGQGS